MIWDVQLWDISVNVRCMKQPFHMCIYIWSTWLHVVSYHSYAAETPVASYIISYIAVLATVMHVCV